MPNLIDELQEYFNSDDLYESLGVEKKISPKHLKKAYHKASLKYHPDRVEDAKKTEATKKFQILGKVYSILSCEEKRKIYDQTGEVDDDNFINDESNDWMNYWRKLFKPITEEDIIAFEKEYKGSEDERKDIKSAYIEYKGDMDRIMESILCSTIGEEDRYREIINELITSKEVKSYKAFIKESTKKRLSRKRKAEKEAVEAEEELKKIKQNGDGSLKSLILAKNSQRQAAGDAFFKHLEEKYGGNVNDGKSKKSTKGKTSKKK